MALGTRENDVTESLQELLHEIEQFGLSYDRAIDDRTLRMLNITRDTGEFLSVLVRAMKARNVLEIGTSNGYSTLWLALAANAVNGRVTTVELSEFKLALAAKNFERSGISHVITQVRGDAGDLLERTSESSFDFIFLDSWRDEYPGWWPNIKRILRKGGLLVVDNAVSDPSDIAPFVALVSTDPEFTTCTVPVGNGEFLATRVSR
jgi:predicted O-methyltransferase YrrM